MVAGKTAAGDHTMYTERLAGQSQHSSSKIEVRLIEKILDDPTNNKENVTNRQS